MKSNYELKRAEKMGFCFGVKEAVDLAETIKAEKKIYMLGMLVHNEHIIKKLEKKGIKVVTEEEVLEGKDPIKEGDSVIIRAHGTIKKIYEILNEKNVIIFDVACIFVKRSREELITHEKSGYKVLFVGDKYHPEVRGIISFGSDVTVIENFEELKNFKFEKTEKYYLLAQTTLNKNIFQSMTEYIEERHKNCKIGNTICGATFERQKAVEKLAKEVDVMLIIGGINSSNTKKLHLISSEINPKSYMIQTHEDLDFSWFKEGNKIGITAGASTPDEIVKKIESILYRRTFDMVDNTDNFEELSFEEMLDQYAPKQVQRGEIVEAEIISKERDYSYLDIKGANEGIVRTEEITEFEVGDIIKVAISEDSDDEGHIRVSRRTALQEEAIVELEAAFEAKGVVTGTIVRKVNGGYIVEVMAHSAFMPNSLSQIRKDSTENVIGLEVEVLIKDIKTERNRKKILVSRRDVVAMAEAEAFAKLSENQIVDVEVKNVLKFGLSVRVEKVLGFIHISEISWGKVDDLTTLYKSGDKIQAQIITLDAEKKSLKLSVKQLTQDPWATAADKFTVDTTVEGEVTKIVKFGAFVKLEDGIEGLVHISDFSWNNKKINLGEFIKAGDKIQVRILDLNTEDKKLKLGIKQLSVDPWSVIDEKFKEGDSATGTIVDTKPYGVFVEVEEGIDSFIHTSDFAWTKLEKKLVVGDKVEFQILAIDRENKKIKGGIKQLTKSPWEVLSEEVQVGTVVTKKISSIADFGIFVDMGYGLDGMIHISQVSKEFVKDLKDKFEVGQEVTAEVIEISITDQKVKLSVKKVELDADKDEDAELLKKYGMTE
ncbi:MAG: 4-hydroxy-3-methylbut-2-enyl diphosphate reductase [Psychrilyobacter sp.]|nr:4-hydroxy-3-methylbut-2-enyl diphosphate reductase [Psychrilyobacter sp.]